MSNLKKSYKRKILILIYFILSEKYDIKILISLIQCVYVCLYNYASISIALKISTN